MHRSMHYSREMDPSDKQSIVFRDDLLVRSWLVALGGNQGGLLVSYSLIGLGLPGVFMLTSAAIFFSKNRLACVT